ncbi:MAG: SDR family NAD(P)-dependent oxidoreductase [Planctomycetales bacterium]|nr:SDR family NAD(P)-dependent oxidoreductase [Planctomycetales bacterium]
MSFWKDQVVLVTGGSAGFGRVLAEAFAAHGARVVLAARNQQTLDATVAQLQADGRDAYGIVCDVTDAQQVEALFVEIGHRFGRLDVLVNNAGRSDRGRAIETSVEEFRAALELNFLALVRCTQAAMPYLLKSRGRMVNIGSLAAKTASPLLGTYPTSKFPVAAYSQQLRLELGPAGVHVLLVCPGPIGLPDRAERYAEAAAESGLPGAAARPGGGVKLRGLDPVKLAERVLRASERGDAELIAPRRVRLLLAISALWPRLGDWIIRKFT